MAELCLGTAQLGMAYGINNKVGKLNYKSAYEILDCAFDQDIQMIDTASIYGEAEKILGKYFFENKRRADKVEIITKQCTEVDGLSFEDEEKEIRRELENSLKLLGRSFIDGYLLHAYREIDNLSTINVLNKLKEEKIVRKIGVSVYDVDEAFASMETGSIDYIQMPYSIFDQRGLQSGIFKKAQDLGIKVFTRSAFLQGLLMMQEKEIPKSLSEIVPYVAKLNKLLDEYSLQKKHAIVKFVLSEPLINYMVFGVETKEQLNSIVKENNESPLPQGFIDDAREEFGKIPRRLILPIFWNC